MSSKKFLGVGSLFFCSLFCFFILVNRVNAAYIENFDDFSTGNINGQNGWTGTASKALITTDQYTSSPNSHSVTGGGEAAGPIQSGGNEIDDNRIASFRFRQSQNTGECQGYFEGNSDGLKSVVNFLTASGEILMMHSAGNTVIGSYSANTWYLIEVEFDVANTRERVRIDGGSWTDWKNFRDSGIVNVSQFLTYCHSTAGTGYFDDVDFSGGLPPAPVADFSGTPTSGDAPLSVDFTDESTNTPTSWYWDFGDGEDDNIQNPTHEFTYAGLYTVALGACNAGGCDTSTVPDYITVSTSTPPEPTATSTIATMKNFFDDSNYGSVITYTLGGLVFLSILSALWIITNGFRNLLNS